MAEHPLDRAPCSGRRRSSVVRALLAALAMASLVAVWGCRGAPPVVASPPAEATPAQDRAPAPLALPASDGSSASARSAPDGFVEMTVAAVIHTDAGPAVILEDLANEMLLPIAIGDAEALAIQVRVDRYRFQRPLTHDLLDAVLQHLGGTIVEVRVDGIRDGVFLGTVFLRGPEGIVPLDARPSDSIALAVGHRVPIYVSADVVDSAAIPRALLEGLTPSLPSEPEEDAAPIEL